MPESVDIAIIGAGAAGLLAAIQAGRSAQARGTAPRILLLEGASRPGAKILVAGGGRCNVTHHAVSERDFCGSSPPAIRNVLRQFDVAATIAFFAEIGVTLKREETGKLFPVTDRAQTVLDALLRAAHNAGAELRSAHRVERVEVIESHESGAAGPRFRVSGPFGSLTARNVILATGGKALPKSGSDGQGLLIAQSLGHSVTKHLFPALVPLTLPKSHWLCELSGLAADVRIQVLAVSGKRLAQVEGALLCTHFGISGPGVLDISRHYLLAARDAAQENAPAPLLLINWLPSRNPDEVDSALLKFGRGVTVLSALRPYGLPDRLLRAIGIHGAGVDPGTLARVLTRPQRKSLVQALTAWPAPIAGDRGFTFAEATAGGVPLREVHLDSMESRVRPGLYLCGEILDVDGRIGGFNFQWAWASGFVAGQSAV